MNKTAIKNFAIWARNKLIADISYRAGLMGITADGIQNALPQSTRMTEFYDIGTSEPYAISGDAVRQRRHLVDIICAKEKETNYKTAYKYVLEEVAYTWFNRLIAVRFMEVNDYLPSHIRVLSSDSGKMEPDLVTTPFDAELSFTRNEEQLVYQLKQENKIDELFRILFIKQCNALNKILPALFEETSDYTELLLNLSVIDQDGVVYHLVHDIPEEYFDVERGGQVEIIGWLYQYYNTEPKNEAFAKKGKITKEEVPAVTQLFTPDWIVRYMVENSLGRLWVEGHPNDGLKVRWKYYLEEADQEPETQAKLAEIRAEYAKLNPEDIKVIDPCMGSGHILVYAFDVLMQIYESAGYGQRDAARSILENNLYGLDIDDRAFQMAYFAVMMKARQYNRRILNGEYKPNVYSIQESNKINRNQLKYFGSSLNDFEKKYAIIQITRLLDAFRDAKEYGSIILVDQYDWGLLYQFATNVEIRGQMSFETVGIEETAANIQTLITQGRLLSQTYHIAVTNPPYMSLSGASPKLNRLIKEMFPNGKMDMYTAFIERCSRFLNKDGFQAMITQHGWLFQPTFEKLRKQFLNNMLLVNLLHLGPRAFDEINGEVVQTAAFVFSRSGVKSYKGTNMDLTKGSSEKQKEDEFFLRKRQYITAQDNYVSLPGVPYAYWVTDRFRKNFVYSKLSDVAQPKCGMATTNNERFLRVWYEPNIENIEFNCSSMDSVDRFHKKWFPYNKGGGFRKWYGNREYVVNWENDGKEIRKAAEGASGGRLVNIDCSFLECLSWSSLANVFSMRYCSGGFMFDSKGACCFTKGDIYYLLGCMNSNVISSYLKLLCPTLDFTPGQIGKVPILQSEGDRLRIDELVKELVILSKEDWDSFEISWDFGCHPLVKKGVNRTQTKNTAVTIEECYHLWTDECNRRSERLKANEEQLNSIFINIYGLQDELTADVEEADLTVRHADLQRDIKSLISYAVGCMFGRYSLGSEGLAYAGGIWSNEKYSGFKPNIDNVIPITDEEYLENDIVSRFCVFLKITFGESTLDENLDYIAKALGNKGNSSREIIRNYFLNNFFKDHCQIYSVTGSGKRPIYWLFDSGKQNGFKALVYLHRYNTDTIGNLRIDYLHRMQRIYENEISRMQDMIDHTTSGREAAQATKCREKLTKQLQECRVYDEKLAHLALSRIELDLDDGVKKNYRKVQTANDGKFYEVLADSKNIMSKE